MILFIYVKKVMEKKKEGEWKGKYKNGHLKHIRLRGKNKRKYAKNGRKEKWEGE